MDILTITVLLCAVGLAVLCGQSLFPHKNFMYFWLAFLGTFGYIGLMAFQIPMTTVFSVFGVLLVVVALGFFEEYARRKKNG